MSREPYRINGTYLLRRDREIIARWTGQAIPDNGDFVLLLTVREWDKFNGLLEMLGH